MGESVPDNIREMSAMRLKHAQRAAGLILQGNAEAARASLEEFVRDSEHCDAIQLAERDAKLEQVRSLLDNGMLSEAHVRLGEVIAPRQVAVEFISGAALFAALPPTNWLCEALEMAPGAPSIFAGFGHSGKTMAAQSLALSVAAGRDVWGSFPCRRGRVLHLDFEQGRTLTLKRYQKLALGMGLGPGDVEDRLTVAPLPRFSLLEPRAERMLTQHAKDTALCIIDSFRASCPELDENSSEARRPLDMLNRVSEATGCTFLVVHHSRKPSKEGVAGGARMEMRGSGALYDAAASLLMFGGAKGEPIRLQHEKARISGSLHDDFAIEIRDLQDADGRFDGVEVVATATVSAAEQPESARRAAESARIQGAIIAALERHPEGLSGNAIREEVGGNRDRVLGSLDLLVAKHRVLVSDGRRNAKLHRLAPPGQQERGGH